MGISMLRPSKPASPVEHHWIRLVLASCGTLCDLEAPMSASEALHSCFNSLIDDKTFNNFLMCDSASLRIGKRPCPVHPDMELELGHLYYVLPIRTYQRRLSWSYISALAAMAMPSSSSPATSSPSKSPFSAANTQMSSYCKRSPPTISKQSAVLQAFCRIPDAKFFLRFLLRHRLLLKGKSKVDGMHTAPRNSYKVASASHLAVDTEGAELSLRGRNIRKFNNICESSEANSKYVELLIERSKSWKPPLQTIQEFPSV